MAASRLVLMVTLMLGLLAPPLAADAQQAGKVPRIGYLAITGGGAMLFAHGAQLAQLATRSRLPLVGTFRQSAQAGYLITYGLTGAPAL